MNSLMEIISNPVVWKVLISYWIFSAAVGALPTPEQDSTKVYIFVFRFAHILGGNVSRAAVTLKVPGATPDTTPPGQP
jgi:hypothetical protein